MNDMSKLFSWFFFFILKCVSDFVSNAYLRNWVTISLSCIQRIFDAIADFYKLTVGSL